MHHVRSLQEGFRAATIKPLEAQASAPVPPSPSIGGGPRLGADVGFIDIGNAIVIAPKEDEKCIELVKYAERLVGLLQRAREANVAPANLTPSGGPIAVEDALVHLLSQLEPAELVRASATCAFWRLAATQVMLSSSWLSRILGACGMRLNVGELTPDVLYDKLESFDDAQASGRGLRCTHALKANDVLVEYAGLSGRLHPRILSDGKYTLTLQKEDVWDAVRCLTKVPEEDLPSVVVHPAAADSMRNWIAASFSPDRPVRFFDALEGVLPIHGDARVFGNVSRFIKDETEAPNCAIGWTAASILAGQPHAYVVALHDIDVGVELSMDYGDSYDRDWQDEESHGSSAESSSA